MVYEELPAVVDPPFLKAGFNFPKLSKVVSALTPPSVSTMTSFSFPSLSVTVVLTGTISLLNNPFF